MTFRDVLIKQAKLIKKRELEKEAFVLPLMLGPPALGYSSYGIGQLMRLFKSSNPKAIIKALGGSGVLSRMAAGGGQDAIAARARDLISQYKNPGAKAMLPWNWSKIRAANQLSSMSGRGRGLDSYLKGLMAPEISSYADNLGFDPAKFRGFSENLGSMFKTIRQRPDVNLNQFGGLLRQLEKSQNPEVQKYIQKMLARYL